MPKRIKPLPCPICGGEPEVDYGLSDCQFETPLVTCPTIYLGERKTVRCPTHADSIEAWNIICNAAKRD